MATLEQCTTALDGFVRKLAAAEGARDLDRTVSCRLTDLGQVVQGRLALGQVHDMTALPDSPTLPKADIDDFARIAAAGQGLAEVPGG